MFESIKIKDVVCDGDAQLIGMRGKRKHICDITATINYTIKTKNNNDNDNDNDDKNILKIIVTDITLDKDFEFEIIYPKISNEFTNLHRAESVNFSKLLKKLIIESIEKFIEIFALK